MEVLRELSDALGSAAETIGSSVVRVEARRRRGGTGVAWSADGIIVTADHVIEREEDVEIGLPNGDTRRAVVAGRDPSSDLAVLKIDGSGLNTGSWSDLRDIKVGHLVLALARPGRSLRARMGIISALGDRWRFPGGAEFDRYLESDVGVYPGFSGGPLIDASGKILGINTAALPGRRTITIPADTVRRVVDSLLTHGRIKRGYFGIAVQPVELSPRLRQDLRQDSALLVVSVEPGSPAEAADIVMGDAIIRVGDQPVTAHTDLRHLLTGERIGSTVRLGIVRAGQVRDVDVLVGERRLKSA